MKKDKSAEYWRKREVQGETGKDVQRPSEVLVSMVHS